MTQWEDECEKCGAPAFAPCAPACSAKRIRPASTRPTPVGEAKRFDAGATDSNAGDEAYIRFRTEHPRAWVVNRHGGSDEMVHRIDCLHFYDDSPSTGQNPKLVGTTWEALLKAEPRLPRIRRCSSCG